VNEVGRIIRFLFWGILVGWIVWLVRAWLRPVVRKGGRNGAGPWNPTAIQLQRDPVCGTFVSPEISVKLKQGSQILHFCSAECRERYLGSRRHTASA
jgi:YHS domain-containing protein